MNLQTSLISTWSSSPIDQGLTIQKKRGLNCHTLEDGRRKPEDEDVGIAAHAYSVRTACLLASSRKFPTFSSTSKSNTLLYLIRM